MNTVKLFANGRSQAVRLPKEYRFEGDEVLINKIGDAVVLYPKSSGWSSLLNACGQFTDDFMAERKQVSDHDKRAGL